MYPQESTESTGASVQRIGRTRTVLPIAGFSVAFDNEGFFWSFDEWNERVFRELCRVAGLDEPTEVHWRVVRFLRDFYNYQRRAPLNNLIKKGTGISLQELESLFPGGIKYGARRLAGLPNPKACTGI